MKPSHSEVLNHQCSFQELDFFKNLSSDNTLFAWELINILGAKKAKKSIVQVPQLGGLFSGSPYLFSEQVSLSNSPFHQLKPNRYYALSASEGGTYPNYAFTYGCLKTGKGMHLALQRCTSLKLIEENGLKASPFILNPKEMFYSALDITVFDPSEIKPTGGVMATFAITRVPVELQYLPSSSSNNEGPRVSANLNEQYGWIKLINYDFFEMTSNSLNPESTQEILSAF